MFTSTARLSKTSLLLLLCISLLWPGCAMADSIGFLNFIYVSSGSLDSVRALLNRSDISGAQVVYSWRLLETSPDQYNFAPIEHDLETVRREHKKLFVQIQDRFFSPDAKNVPPYLLSDPKYGGGIVSQIDNPGENKKPVSGWVAQQWNPSVRLRFQSLLRALADRFDGEIYGVNLPETAIDIDTKRDRSGFTCDGYFDAELNNIEFARKVFKRSYVVQYVNFWPCEWNNSRTYMSRLFAFAAANRIGLGGPDVIPYRKGQMHNSYPFFYRYRGKLELIAMAVQEPTLTYRNPKTGQLFTRTEFEHFARDYLGAAIIFWSPSAWLRGQQLAREF